MLGLYRVFLCECMCHRMCFAYNRSSTFLDVCVCSQERLWFGPSSLRMHQVSRRRCRYNQTTHTRLRSSRRWNFGTPLARAVLRGEMPRPRGSRPCWPLPHVVRLPEIQQSVTYVSQRALLVSPFRPSVSPCWAYELYKGPGISAPTPILPLPYHSTSTELRRQPASRHTTDWRCSYLLHSEYMALCMYVRHV
jgi:hypothetical protein